MRTLVLLFCCFALVTTVSAQSSDTLALDPGMTVNEQILADQASGSPHAVYSVAPGQFYAFDGRMDLTFPVEIVGPDNGWIKDDATPPVLVTLPDEQGLASRQFFEIQEGGSLVLKNLLMSGLISTAGEIVGNFTTNTGGTMYMAHNVAFSDYRDHIFQNSATGIDISITDCIFINGLRPSNSPWGGFPIRMNVAGENVTIENNTSVNSGRLLTNSGPFFNATIHELHNTYVNSAKAGHEQRAFEMIQANNIYYNYDFLGRKESDNDYDSRWTTWNYYADVKDSLDKNSLYLGHNLFFREAELLEWFEVTSPDTILAGLLWEGYAEVDSVVTEDDDYTIGTNYSGFDPEFTTHPGNKEALLAFTEDYWLDTSAEWVDWRIPSAVTFDDLGVPSLTAWPPAFDLSYGNEYLMTAGSDGLPLGDLNWYPEAKETYMANRDANIEALRAMKGSTEGVYVPGSPTPLITPENVAVEDLGGEVPTRYSLDQNYPNPFNPTTNIEFTLPKSVDVNLAVYNLLGQRVALLVNNQTIAAGTHRVQWDGRDVAGNLAASGVYIYRIEADDFTQSRKMLFLK